MRIFYASGNSPNAEFDSNLWRSNLYLALVNSGHDVVEFDYELRDTFRFLDPAIPQHAEFIEHNRPRLTAELRRQIKHAHAIKPIDLFFSYFYDACVLPEALDEIRALGIKTVNWYCNGSNLLRLVTEISPRYDWCLVPEKFRLQDYVTMGARPIYCQEAANPDVYKPYDMPVEFDVTFVGQAYGERPAWIKHLLDEGIDVRVWGYGWNGTQASGMQPHEDGVGSASLARKLVNPQSWKAAARRLSALTLKSGPAAAAETLAAENRVVLPPEILGSVLSDTEVIQMYSRSKINLGFSTVVGTGDERLLQVRLRDFEVPMSGGFYMVEYMDELKEFFDIGKEIICYTSLDDLVEKIKYFLTHDHERETIRRAGFDRCRRDHTWQKRFEMAFKEMGLN